MEEVETAFYHLCESESLPPNSYVVGEGGVIPTAPLWRQNYYLLAIYGGMEGGSGVTIRSLFF